jgi:hypothetical protein
MILAAGRGPMRRRTLAGPEPVPTLSQRALIISVVIRKGLSGAAALPTAARELATMLGEADAGGRRIGGLSDEAVNALAGNVPTSASDTECPDLHAGNVRRRAERPDTDRRDCVRHVIRSLSRRATTSVGCQHASMAPSADSARSGL